MFRNTNIFFIYFQNWYVFINFRKKSQMEIKKDLTNCPQCGGPLVYDPIQKTLFCEHCQSHFNLDGKPAGKQETVMGDALRKVIDGMASLEPEMVVFKRDNNMMMQDAMKWLKENHAPKEMLNPGLYRLEKFYVPAYFLIDHMKDRPSDIIIRDLNRHMIASNSLPHLARIDIVNVKDFELTSDIIPFQKIFTLGVPVLDLITAKEVWEGYDPHLMQIFAHATSFEEFMNKNYPEGNIGFRLIYLPGWLMECTFKDVKYTMGVTDLRPQKFSMVPELPKKSWFKL